MSAVVSTTVSPYECPICFLSYADVDPTTFPCGHSCCLIDAKILTNCHLCRVKIPEAQLLMPNYTLRDGARFDKDREKKLIEDNLKIESLRNELSQKAAINDKEVTTSQPKKKKEGKKDSSVMVPGTIIDDSHLESDSDSDVEENVTSTSTSSANPVRSIDPDTLKKYKLRVYPATKESKEPSSNAEKIFFRSCSVKGFYTAFMSTAIITGRDVLIHTAIFHAQNPDLRRFILQNNEHSVGLMIDIVGLKVSPLSLIHKSYLKNPDETLKEIDRNTFPLLLLKYNYCTKEMLLDPAVVLSGLRSDETPYGFTATTDAINEAHAYLQQKELVLAPAYVKRFGEENNIRVFRPSFIVPMSIEESEIKKEEGCCSLDGCSNPGWAICAKCKSAQYCSREHQIEHWKKVHKNVCGKTHTELAALTPTKDEPSVVIPMKSPGDGKFGSMISLTSGKTRNLKPDDIFRNIHGDKKFLVKIQLGMNGYPPAASRTGPMSIYDETRSFTASLDNAIQPQYGIVNEAVFRNGIDCFALSGTHERLKAYMYAKREGNNLRIYTNQFAPQPNW